MTVPEVISLLSLYKVSSWACDWWNCLPRIDLDSRNHLVVSIFKLIVREYCNNIFPLTEFGLFVILFSVMLSTAPKIK